VVTHIPLCIGALPSLVASAKDLPQDDHLSRSNARRDCLLRAIGKIINTVRVTIMLLRLFHKSDFVALVIGALPQKKVKSLLSAGQRSLVSGIPLRLNACLDRECAGLCNEIYTGEAVNRPEWHQHGHWQHLPYSGSKYTKLIAPSAP